MYQADLPELLGDWDGANFAEEVSQIQPMRRRSARLEEEDSNLSKVEVDEVLGFVGNIGSEIAAYDAMPGWVVLLVEFLLDEGGDVLLNVELLEGLGGNVNSVLLHVLGHVCVLNNCLSVCHSDLLLFLRA